MRSKEGTRAVCSVFSPPSSEFFLVFTPKKREIPHWKDPVCGNGWASFGGHGSDGRKLGDDVRRRICRFALYGHPDRQGLAQLGNIMGICADGIAPGVSHQGSDWKAAPKNERDDFCLCL